MKKRVVRRFRKPGAMAQFAAGLLLKALRGKNKGPLIAALPGGRTAEPFFKALAGLKADWGQAHFFMSDERLVPSGSAASNFGQAGRLFFSKVNMPPASLHAVKGRSPGRAAAAYERDLLFWCGPTGGPDIVFLGLGEDGHTASLFPGAAALGEKTRLILPARAPKDVKPAARITMTLKAIRSAGTVVLMASGPAKKAVFARAAAGDAGIPAGRLAARGCVYFLFSDGIKG